MHFSIHHKTLAHLGNFTNRLFLMPHPTAIGNASEDYLFGLLYAKKHRRKLVTLTCHPMLAKTGLRLFEPKLLLYGNDLTKPKYGSVSYKMLSFLISIYFLCLRIFVKVIYKVFKKNFSDNYYHPSIGQDIIWQPRNCKEFDWKAVEKIDWDATFADIELKLKLPQKKQKYCENLFKEFGLPEGAWFVCVHVREGGYSGDFQNHRNSKIDNYLEAFEFITSQGGWIFRMGDSSMKKIPPLDQVIDYANSDKRTALLDIFLIANCKFFIGTSSGILDTAMLFGKPILLTNAVHWLMQLPPKSSDLIIFKHVYSKLDDSELTLKDWLLAYNKIEPSSWSSSDWYFIENSSQEITTAVKEFLGYSMDLKNFELQKKFKNLHLNSCKELSLNFKINQNARLNISNWFRIATGLVSWSGNIGSSYLEENWD